MSGRYLGVVALERFLAVERYCQAHQAGAPTHSSRNPEPGGRGERAKAAPRPGGATWAKVR